MPDRDNRRAFITGISGQDGSYLAEYLLQLGYRVFGFVRQSDGFASLNRLKQAIGQESYARLELIHGDITDEATVRHAVDHANPDEIYHLAAQSSVELSFAMPEYTRHCIAGGTVNLLEAVRRFAAASDRQPRIFNALTSELFGESDGPLSETSAVLPRSPYGIAKAAAYQFATEYRQAHGLYVANGIMFNHESPRRGLNFVTRKITRALAEIKIGIRREPLMLGNLQARRDWGFAGDYIVAMHRMLQPQNPRDFVVATGVVKGISDVLDIAANELGLDWHGWVKQDAALLRPADARVRVGDPTRIHDALGWKARMPFDAMIRQMARADVESLATGRHEIAK